MFGNASDAKATRAADDDVEPAIVELVEHFGQQHCAAHLALYLAILPQNHANGQGLSALVSHPHIGEHLLVVRLKYVQGHDLAGEDDHWQGKEWNRIAI